MKKIIAHSTEINGTRQVTCAFKYNSIYSTTVTIRPFKGTVTEFFNQNPAKDIPLGTIVYTQMSLPRLVKELSTLAANQEDELVVDVQWANDDESVTVFMQRQYAGKNAKVLTSIPEFGLATAPFFPKHLNMLSLHTHPLIGFRNKLLEILIPFHNKIPTDFEPAKHKERMESIINKFKHIPLLLYFGYLLPSETDILSFSGSVTGAPVGPFSSKPLSVTRDPSIHQSLETGSLIQSIFLYEFKTIFKGFLKAQTETLAIFTEYIKQFHDIFWKDLSGGLSDKTLKKFVQTISKVMENGVMEKLVELLNKSDYATKNGLQFTLGLSHKMDLIDPQNPGDHPFMENGPPSSLDSRFNQFSRNSRSEDTFNKRYIAAASAILLFSMVLSIIVTPTLLHWMYDTIYGE